MEEDKSKSIISNVVIILTSTVTVSCEKHWVYQTKPEERLSSYLKSIRRWIEETNFRIVVVENSGYKFAELDEYIEKHKDRFELVLFKEDEVPFEMFERLHAAALADPEDYMYTSKGTSEMFSINYVMEKSEIAKKSDFIIKITARYFIPAFETFISSKNLNDYYALRQNCYEFCEIVGVHKDHFNEIFYPNNFIAYDTVCFHHIESLYKHRLDQLLQDKVLVCDVFEIEPTFSGGDWSNHPKVTL